MAWVPSTLKNKNLLPPGKTKGKRWQFEERGQYGEYTALLPMQGKGRFFWRLDVDSAIRSRPVAIFEKVDLRLLGRTEASTGRMVLCRATHQELCDTRDSSLPSGTPTSWEPQGREPQLEKRKNQ